VQCRLILAKREAKAVTEADTEALDWWYDLEDDFELLSFKAWNAVIYQVTVLFLSSYAGNCLCSLLLALLSIVVNVLRQETWHKRAKSLHRLASINVSLMHAHNAEHLPTNSPKKIASQVSDHRLAVAVASHQVQPLELLKAGTCSKQEILKAHAGTHPHAA